MSLDWLTFFKMVGSVEVRDALQPAAFVVWLRCSPHEPGARLFAYDGKTASHKPATSGFPFPPSALHATLSRLEELRFRTDCWRGRYLDSG